MAFNLVYEGDLLLQELEKKIVDVVEKILPCVVSVSTTTLARIDLFRVAPIQGQGSGVIFDKDGIIVTNAHVVKNASKVEVRFTSGEKLEAKVIGRVPGQDIAFLKVDAKNLPAIKIGNSSSLKVGQFAIAIGNPLGLGESVTFGLISALNRTIVAQNAQLEGLIQTTAEINPGNSGGALVNTSGELIGIPTAVIPYSQGIGFAIEIDSIKGVLEEFSESGSISTPWLGIVGYSIDRRIANYYRLPVDKGALVLDVPAGPAKSAGIRKGDIITAIDGEEVNSIQLLTQKIVKRRIDDEVKITLVRNTDLLEIMIRLCKAPK